MVVVIQLSNKHQRILAVLHHVLVQCDDSITATDTAVQLAVKTRRTVRLQTSASAARPTLCQNISTRRPTMNCRRKAELLKIYCTLSVCWMVRYRNSTRLKLEPVISVTRKERLGIGMVLIRRCWLNLALSNDRSRRNWEEEGTLGQC